MRSLFPIAAILLGSIFDVAHQYSGAIRFLLMLMLFAAFIELRFDRLYKSFHNHVFFIVAANFILSFLWYLLLAPFDIMSAQIAFLTAISPTATAAPAMVGFWRGNVEYTTISVILTNSAVALAIPFLSVTLFQVEESVSSLEILRSVFILIAIPLVLSQLWNQINRSIQWSVPWKALSFWAWIVLLFLASAKTSHFIHYDTEVDFRSIVKIALFVILICTTNFSIGKQLGRSGFPRETSQSLGHKNTMFTVWFSFSFLSPDLALGPMLYVVVQNIYNAYQLSQIDRLSID
ncbi:MAG: hypothetical protein J7642_12010 [Cyanobacteria bacterium SBC]|nr:hypothetical protein [Cyanobacteria bacterium SBC]